MVVFYDFDGTLTPYPIPKYEVLKSCNEDSDNFQRKVLELSTKMNISLYDAYFDVFKSVMMNNGLSFSSNVVSMGADKVEFNPGAIEFLKDLKDRKVHQYIVTSGYAEYVRKTDVSNYVDDIFGTEFKDDNEDGVLDTILTDSDKVKVIKEVLNMYNGSQVVYFGDGLTDKDAFAYVHSIGGKSIFIGPKNDIYETLNNHGIIDEAFDRDFTKESALHSYFNKLLK